jgi:predicted TIM-barrel fold metal-dependent hydrolase
MNASRLFCTFLVFAIGGSQNLFAEPSASSLQDRRQIIPLVGAHQHLLSPATLASLPHAPSLPVVRLPTDLEQLLEARDRLPGSTELGTVFTDDALLLQLDDYTWAHGTSQIKAYMSLADKGLKYFPNAYAVRGSAGYIAGTVRSPPNDADVQSFLFALQKGPDSKWHIAVETDANIAKPEFTKAITADELVQELDDAGIQRGVVLSLAYWYGSPLHPPINDEYAQVRAENDWTAQQVARYPNRLVFFCGVNPLKDYAIEELERCAKLPQMKGMKLHFANSGVDVRNPEHLEKLRRFFRAVNSHRLAMVIHAMSLRDDYGRKDSEIFLTELLPLVPDVPVQIAHLAGSGPGYHADADSAMAVYADARAAGDPRTKNLYFDVATDVTVPRNQSKETLELIAKRIRQVGLGRIFFGSDMSTSHSPEIGIWWVTFRNKIPLSNDELRVIANNVPPYLR